MSRDAAKEGLDVRSEVLGADYVAQSLDNLTEYRRPLMELVTDYGWGTVWARPGLDRWARSLVTIAATAATGHQGELGVHVRGALRQGVTPAQIREVLLQLAVYCGVPTAAEAFSTVEAVLADTGYSAEGVTAPTSVPVSQRAMLPSIGTKVTFLFQSASARPTPELSQALHDEIRRLQTELPYGLSCRAGIGIEPAIAAPALQALQAGERTDFGRPGYQGLLWVEGPAGAIDAQTAATSGIANRLGSIIDPAMSAAVAGTDEVFLQGDGPLAGMYAIRRRPGDSYEHFHDFWRMEHTKLSMHIPGFRYRQLHAVGYVSQHAAELAGVGVADIDGVVEYFFDDIQFQIEMTNLDQFPEIYADEKNFIDHSRATFTYVEFLN